MRHRCVDLSAQKDDPPVDRTSVDTSFPFLGEPEVSNRELLELATLQGTEGLFRANRRQPTCTQEQHMQNSSPPKRYEERGSA
jgi:hypothetical protein